MNAKCKHCGWLWSKTSGKCVCELPDQDRLRSPLRQIESLPTEEEDYHRHYPAERWSKQDKLR